MRRNRLTAVGLKAYNIITGASPENGRKVYIMQRTVHGTKFTYVKSTLVNGQIESKVETITVQEADERKALKKAYKEVGAFQPVLVEKVDALYYLDDEIFFKYAVKVDPKTATEDAEN